MRKIGGIVVVLVVLGLVGLLAGCGVSKAGYEDRMAKILEDTKEELEKSMVSATGKAGEKAKAKKEKDSNQEQVDILKETKRKIERINPPDDFFSGHSDLIEFLDLFITLKEKQVELEGIKPKKKDQDQKRAQIQQEVFEAYQGGLTALSRASQELPFLEYELRQSFKNLLQTSQPTLNYPPGGESIETLPAPPSR